MAILKSLSLLTLLSMLSLASTAALPTDSYPALVKRNSGQMTSYDPTISGNVCNIAVDSTRFVVALSPDDVHENLCGRTVQLFWEGNESWGTVIDFCEACREGDIDVSNNLFQAVAPGQDGVVLGVSWTIV